MSFRGQPEVADAVTNIGIQVFTFDATERALQLLRVLELFAIDAPSLRVVWQDRDGTNQRRPLKRVVSGQEPDLKLNECSIQIPARQFRSGLKGIGVLKTTAHLDISPDCQSWAHSTTRRTHGTPAIRRAFTWAAGLERSAAFRKPVVMPTVLAVTLVLAPGTIKSMVQPVCQMVNSTWLNIKCGQIFGAIDFGDEWLFFPNSGYNPNVSELFAFLGEEASICWPAWRQTHNISFEKSASEEAPADLTVHSLHERRPAHSGH